MSRDVLFYTLAVCAAVVTFFIAWFSLSVIRILRGVTSVIEEVRSRIERVGAAIEDLTERVTHSTASLSAVAAGVKELLGFLGRRRAKNAKSKSSSADENE
jgi:methyl-accepting chemotaxis protein